MAWLRKQSESEVRTVTLPRIAFAIVGAGLVFYGMRKQGGVVKKLASSAGFGILAKTLGSTPLAGASAGLAALLSRTGVPLLNSQHQ